MASIISNNDRDKHGNEIRHLTRSELGEIFDRYDTNHDGVLQVSEMNLLVTDVYKKYFKKTDLTESDNAAILKTVNELINIRDTDKNGVIDWNEFYSYYEGKNIIESTHEGLSENSRALVYASRLAVVLRRLPSIMSYSRPLAYASELGESVRPLVNKSFVRFMYAVSWGYVFLDTGVKTHSVKSHGNEAMMYSCFDTSVFHCFASMALPAFTIHSIVKYSGKLIKKTLKESKLSKFLPTALGIISIPFIIHPLDHGTEWVMDKTIRTFYFNKVPYLKEEYIKHHKHN